MRYLRKIIAWTVACLSLCAMFTGCGTDKNVYVPITSNTLEVTAEGHLIAYIVEDFDKDYYDINELKTMVDEEIAAYNQAKANLVSEAGQVPITVDKVMMAEDGSKKVVVALSCANAAVYSDYMGAEVFYGTVAQAAEKGYVLDGMLKSVKNDDPFIGETLKKNQDKNILIIKDAVMVRTYNKVAFLSKNASITQEGFVNAQTKDELKYIIIK